MNERIADILDQAFDRCKKYDDEGNTGLVKTTEALHLFAELIVRECIDCINETDKGYVFTAQDAGIVGAAHNRSIKTIKEHFGVE